MWFWILVALIGLAAALLVALVQPAPIRRRGLILVGVALAMALGIEALIRTGTISVDRGPELLFLAVILLTGWAIWRLPRPRQDGR